jgi:predicted ATPase
MGLVKAATTCVYRFLHDRVQQAAYSLIPEEEREGMHLRIGRLLLAHMSAEEMEEELFMIVNHFDMGYKFITDPEERWKVAMLNYKAGKKTSSVTAYNAALKYLDIALFLLGEGEEALEGEKVNCWDEDHSKSTIAVFMEAAVVHYLNVDAEGAGKLCQVKQILIIAIYDSLTFFMY